MRHNQRQHHELRSIQFTRHYTPYAEGAVLTEFGKTKVICTATVVPSVPRFLKGTGQGWITAEYGMLPRATQERTEREAVKGRQGGRTLEIQRLIGRSLRAAVNLKALGENTITLDCDVIQADGGTRTAAITGACVALVDALKVIKQQKSIHTNPLRHLIAAISVGIHQNQALLDLDYYEDSNAQTDLNVVMDEHGGFIEIQGTAEGQPFSPVELTTMLELAKQGIQQLIAKQKAILGIP